MFSIIIYIGISGIKALETSFVDSKACDNGFPGLITDAMLCVRKHESCNIVQGAPIVCRQELQGVFSWDSTTMVANRQGGHSPCGQRKEDGLGVVSKLCLFNDWLESTMASN